MAGKKKGGAEHKKNASPSKRDKHTGAQGAKANQRKVNAWKKYKAGGGKLSLSAWLKQNG